MIRTSRTPTILVAPDSFKGTLTAVEAARAMERGVRQAISECSVVKVPMADGGEGTAEALCAATGGILLRTPAPDPLGRTVVARFARLGDGKTFAVDAASASGLCLLSEGERNPLITTSAGVGVLVGRAVQMGARRIILGVGGTAFVDGGVGMMSALGMRFTDAEGRPLDPGGGSLGGLETIDPSGLERAFAVGRVQIVVAADVDNPLLGPEGAAATYGPQKGAGPDDVKILERGLARLAERLRQMTGVDLSAAARTGAGGGLSLLPVALLAARVRPGAEVVAEAVSLEQKLEGCDLVIVGEGSLDGQTIRGKAPAHVARAAAARGIDVVAVAGRLGPDVEKVRSVGISKYTAASPEGPPSDRARAEALVVEATATLVREVFATGGRA